MSILINDEISITDLIKKTVEDNKQQIFLTNDEYKELVRIKDNEGFVQFLMNKDPTKVLTNFLQGYGEWANNDTRDTRQLTLVSRIRNFVGTFCYGTPESQNMPFYFYYTGQDKLRSAPYHFSTEQLAFNEYRLFVNRYTREFRQKMTVRLAMGLVVFSLAMGVIVKPSIEGVKSVYADIKQSRDEANSIQDRIDKVDANLAIRKAEIVVQATELKKKYSEGSISAEEFNLQAERIKKEDAETTKNANDVKESLTKKL